MRAGSTILHFSNTRDLQDNINGKQKQRLYSLIIYKQSKHDRFFMRTKQLL